MSMLIKQKVFKRGDDGLFDPFEIVHQHQVHREGALKQKYSADSESKARLSAAKASMAELALAQQKGKLVNVDRAIRIFTDQIVTAKTRLLAIPTRVAPRLATAKSTVEARETINNEILEALVDLSEPPSLKPDEIEEVEEVENE